MDSDVQTLISGDQANALTALNNFVAKNVKIFNFPELNENNYRKSLWESLGQILCDEERHDLHENALYALRMLSRDKTDLEELITPTLMDSILHHAKLIPEAKKFTKVYHEVNAEALKCMFNMVYNSKIAVALISKDPTMESILSKVHKYSDCTLTPEIRFFHMKILFMITAICKELRSKIKRDLHAFTYLVDTLDLILKESNKKLSEEQVNLSTLILQIVFTLSVDETYKDEKEYAWYTRLMRLLHDYLLFDVCDSENKMKVHRYAVNLMTALPSNTFKELRTPILDGETVAEELQFEDQNMSAVHEMIIFLKAKLEESEAEEKPSNSYLLPPILTVLLRAAQEDRFIRKYLRIHILPPLKDVRNRPEHGNTLRNYLCRLLTSHGNHDHIVVAELLFEICKKNANRLVKYTGYGNAAGLFAARGLLGLTKKEPVEYSSDSADSDTEEYKQQKKTINPILGCHEDPHPDPTAHMTEEQKEHEVMKFIEILDNFDRTGMVRPCRIGPDGKPEPISHVLELQEGLHKDEISSEGEND